MIDISKLALKSIKYSLIFALPFMFLVYVYGRPPVEWHYYTLAFEREVTAEERDRALGLLQARLEELAHPSWEARIRPNIDGTLTLGYQKRGGPGELAGLLMPQGKAEFRFMYHDQREAPDAQEHGPPDGYVVMEYLETCFRYDEETGKPVMKLIPCIVEDQPILQPTGFREVSFWTEGFIRESHLRFEFHPGDTERLVEAQARRPDAPVALIVDGYIRVGYRCLGPIETGGLETIGLLDNEPIEQMAVALRHGPLPAPLTITDYTTLGPE